MQRKEKECGAYAILVFFSGVILTIVGLTLIPPLIKKYAGKGYKSSLKRETINISDMGPEIVPNKGGSRK